MSGICYVDRGDIEDIVTQFVGDIRIDDIESPKEGLAIVVKEYATSLHIAARILLDFIAGNLKLTDEHGDTVEPTSENSAVSNVRDGGIENMHVLYYPNLRLRKD